MQYWFEVFDNSEVQWLTRKRVAKVTLVVPVASVLTLIGIILGPTWGLPIPLVGGFLLMAWSTLVWIILNRLQKLRRVVWCIKISERCVEGYDYTRKKPRFDWIRIARVELAQDGLLLVGPEDATLEIPHLFPDFAALSPRIVFHADFYDIPIFINGQPWEEIDVYNLFPFLEEF